VILNQDIIKISKKLGWDPEIVQYSFKKLFKDEDVSSDILSKKNIIEFFKICSESKDVNDRKNKLIKFFRSNLNKDIVKTVIYFLLRDLLFVYVWHFFDYLDDNRIKGRHYKPTKDVIGKNMLNPFLSILWMCKFNALELLKKSEIIVDYLIYDNISRFMDHNKTIAAAKELIYNLIPEIGLNVLNIRPLREYFLGLISSSSSPNDFDDKIIKLLLFHKKKESRKQHWFYYFMVEGLMKRGYGTRESFRLVGKYFERPPTTIHRRYYDKKKEIKDKRLDTNKVIQELNLRDINKVLELIDRDEFHNQRYYGDQLIKILER